MLITGGSGFVGWNAVRYFVERGVDVVASYRSLPHYLQTVDGHQAVDLDLTDRLAIEEVVARFQPALILHTAAITRPQRSDDAAGIHGTNVEATARLAEAAGRCGAGLIFLSTDLVYPDNAGLVDERTPIAPSGAGEYSRSKALAEQIVRASSARSIVLRPTLMFGDGPPGGNSFSMFIERKWANAERAPLFVDQFRSFLFVDDLLSAIETVAMRHGAWGELFVCGGPERMSRAEFGARYASALGVSDAMIAPMRAAELEGYIGGPSDITLDSSKLRSLGWIPRSVEQAVRAMLSKRSGAGAGQSTRPSPMSNNRMVLNIKNEIRREALDRRNALSESERAEASLAICQRIMADDRFLDARGVHVYLPIGSEVDIRPLIDVAWELGKGVGLMRVSEDGGSRQYRITPETTYTTGTLGIAEPNDAEAFDMDRCDLVIVPLVAADEEGNRVGYGKGYYDQFLTHFPRPTIGAAFDVQVFPQLPNDELDIQLDAVITETRVLGRSTQGREGS